MFYILPTRGVLKNYQHRSARHYRLLLSSHDDNLKQSLFYLRIIDSRLYDTFSADYPTQVISPFGLS